MKTKENLTQVKKESAEKIQCAIELRFNELKNSDDFKELKDQCEKFVEDPYDKDNTFYFDEGGALNSAIGVDFSAFASEDFEVLEALQEELCDFGYFSQDCYSQGKAEWTLSQCLGEPIIFNESPERHCYAIYSDELDLKIQKVNSEEHGLALIEQSMRVSGVFDNIVSVDYNGNFCAFVSTNLGKLTDKEVDDLVYKLEITEEL